MSSGGSIRKTLGALKDTTTVSLAKINSDYKVPLMSSYLVQSCILLLLLMIFILVVFFRIWTLPLLRQRTMSNALPRKGI